MSKNIVFCADGTWNGPQQDENNDQIADPTNVYKLFNNLAGEVAQSACSADEQEKYAMQDGHPLQVAKYLHGVGDSSNLFIQIFGGGLGVGTICRIVRGYTFISRHYEPGDHIYITGFSRGAYTARALAGLICSKGLLSQPLACDPDKKRVYQLGIQTWRDYRQGRQDADGNLLSKLSDLIREIPLNFTKPPSDRDYTPVDHIQAVAVWDTVGSLGIPTYDDETQQRLDMFRFADTALNPKVVMGLHAISLDEMRPDFSPTLWDQRTGITQMLFPGAHADVGGGYPTSDHESELSDIALDWMQQALLPCGLHLARAVPQTPTAAQTGVAHQPWIHAPWSIKPRMPRCFPKHIDVHPSVTDRMQASLVISEPGTTATAYAPVNRP
ncbi:uncharacterized protein (DUF2235 family) [Chitinivorax tropicus]|uniref:Uncharacterized protein (DUF2235 family) n=1 Tax=Chitinivorax tropicus TaxID=714531 RepID=A0A840MSF2_9PROT|nr:DUF2235 domain-containing protein [Chitinivorax tropicus]MBB5020009.1 uncharacterized protein (DUF2235 family) [Chitinivorax tropicus]